MMEDFFVAGSRGTILRHCSDDDDNDSVDDDDDDNDSDYDDDDDDDDDKVRRQFLSTS